MSLEIVQIDPVKDRNLLETATQHLFPQWKAHYLNFFDDIKSPETLMNYYVKQYPETTMYIAVDENRSFVGCYTLINNGKIHWMCDVYVVPERRKQKVGELLVKNAQSRVEKIVIQVEQPLVAFYEKYGFKQGEMFIFKGKQGQDFHYRYMLYKSPTLDTSRITMIIVILCLIGLGLISIVMIM
jgi:GNAT superfamily N-acetyltransferase